MRNTLRFLLFISLFNTQSISAQIIEQWVHRNKCASEVSSVFNCVDTEGNVYYTFAVFDSI